MKNGLLHTVAVRVVPFLVSVMMRLWFFTCRITVHGRDHEEKALNCGVPYIGTFWHYSFFYTFYRVRGQKAVVMVSASRDGEYIARLAGHFGFGTVRGSRNKRGLGAIKQLMTAVKKGENSAIVADGSQGPALKLQAGAIMLASRTGAVIAPMAWSANKYWTVGSWDRTAIPKPFSKIEYFYGEPIFIEKKLDAEELEMKRVDVEKRLLELYKKAWEIQGKDSH